MKKSESIKEIATALCKFQTECPKIEKNKTVKVQTKSGSSYNFQYADMDEITTKIKKTMSDCKLSYTQIPETDWSVTTILMHSSWEWLEWNLSILPEWSKVWPQDIWSAITYAKRYALASMLWIIADEDDDWNSASWNTYSYWNQQPKEKHTCKKCWEVVEASPFDWKFGRCFKCPECNQFSWTNPVFDWKDLSKQDF